MVDETPSQKNHKHSIIFLLIVMVLTSVAILLTLWFSGHFKSSSSVDNSVIDDKSPQIKKSDSQDSVESDLNETDILNSPPPPNPIIHDIHQAGFVCNEKIKGSVLGKITSYSKDYRASYHILEDNIYKVMYIIDYVGVGEQINSTSSVICEVDAITGKISNYKELPMD